MNGTQILFAIITGVIALYGAVLSTINLIRENKKNQRKLTISVSIGFLTYAHGLSDDQLIITIANSGFKNLTINTPN